MAADTFLSMASSRPLRGTALVLLLLLSFYLGNPFSRPQTEAPSSPSIETKENWVDYKDPASELIGSSADPNASVVEVHEGGPRIRQASMIYASSEYNAVYERAIASHIRHGKRWNNPTHILRHDIVEAGFFNKPAFLLGLIIEEMTKPYGQRSDWIVWVDADSILFNVEVPWSLFLPPAEFSDIHFLGTKDQNGFNAGMLFIRVHKWSVNMLAQVITIKETHPEVHIDFEDQGALAWALERPGYEEHVIYQPHNWWNSFGLEGKPFDHDRFVLHFAGVGCCGGEAKDPTMLRWLDLIEQEPDHFTRPVSNLTLQAEVREYWDMAISAQAALVAAQQWGQQPKYSGKDIQTARSELRKTLLSSADDLGKMKASITRLEEAKRQVDDGGDQHEKSKGSLSSSGDVGEDEES